METQKPIINLSPQQLRVLGSLIEKSRTTPEYYPLTLNTLQSACNQKTSRKPVVSYSQQDIIESLDQLKKAGLISTVLGGGSRVIKYKHNLAIHYPFVAAQLAILCVLFLRGPLTAGEINTYSARLYEFDDLDELQDYLDQLTHPENPYIKLLDKKAGQKESRYIHLFSDSSQEEYIDSFNQEDLHIDQNNNALVQRIEVLENQLAELRKDFDDLLAQLT